MLPLYARSTTKLRKPDGFFPRSAFLNICDLRGPRKVDHGQNVCTNLWSTQACTIPTWISDGSHLESKTSPLCCLDDCGGESAHDLFHFQSENILQVAECYDKIEELLVQFDPCLIEDYVALVSNSKIFDFQCITITLEGIGATENHFTHFTAISVRSPMIDAEFLVPQLFGNVNETTNERHFYNLNGLEYLCEDDLMLMPEPVFGVERLCGDYHRFHSGILLDWKSCIATEDNPSLGCSSETRIFAKPEYDISEELRLIDSIWEEDSIPENRTEVFDLVSFETIDLTMLKRGRASSFGCIPEPMRQLTLLPWPNSLVWVSDERSTWKVGFLLLDTFQSRIDGRHLLRLDSPSLGIRAHSRHFNKFCTDYGWPKTKILIDIRTSTLNANHPHHQGTEFVSFVKSHAVHSSSMLETFVRTALITPVTLFDDELLQRKDVETLAVTKSEPPRHLQASEIIDTIARPASTARQTSVLSDSGYSSRMQQLLQKVGGEESGLMNDVHTAVDYPKSQSLPDEALKFPITRTILMSEEFFEQQTECFHALREHFGINSVDYPFRDSADIVISEVCCIKTITLQEMGNISEKREFIKGLCDLSFRYSFIWVVFLVENVDKHDINSLLIPFAQSLACFPARVIVRLCTASTLPSHIASIIDEDLRQSNQDQRSLSGYYMREFCKSLNSRPDLSAMCDFLQQFPTINIFTAALIITSFPSILAVVKANPETIAHSLRQWVPVPKVDRLLTNLIAFFALLHVRFK